MAIGAITVAEKQGGAPSAPLFVDRISFAGDAAYPTGGMALEALFQAAVKSGRKIIGVVPNDCGGYIPAYVPSTGKLLVYRGDNDNAGDAPAVEVANAVNLSAVTFNLVVLSA